MHTWPKSSKLGVIHKLRVRFFGQLLPHPFNENPSELYARNPVSLNEIVKKMGGFIFIDPDLEHKRFTIRIHIPQIKDP